ncbi:MAG TPA: hypothetical protein EYP56_07265 [Planctomycetaceae bacterium]|nr:hypothetical protein [Planctomycetaceae bacterium]
MEINRNQYYFAGLVLLLLGLQYHFVDSLVLTPGCAQLLYGDSDRSAVAASSPLSGLGPAATAAAPKTLRPPEWLSYALLSIGAVLVLHSWAMPKPGG